MADITSILTSVGGSIDAIQRLVSGFAYIIGLYFAMKSISIFRDIGDFRARSPSNIKMFVPIAYMLAAAAFIFLPTMLEAGRNTLFGAISPLSYGNWVKTLFEKYGQATYVVIRLIQTAGVIWFMRGIYLLVASAEPGKDEAKRGIVFLVAGIFAVNFNLTSNWLNSFIQWVIANV